MSEELKDARCPKCGSEVFLPKNGLLQGNDEEKSFNEKNPIVWCVDMGHWAGNLSECSRPEPPKEAERQCKCYQVLARCDGKQVHSIACELAHKKEHKEPNDYDLVTLQNEVDDECGDFVSTMSLQYIIKHITDKHVELIREQDFYDYNHLTRGVMDVLIVSDLIKALKEQCLTLTQ